MDHYDLRAEVLAALRAVPARKLQERGKEQPQFCCPRHNDKNPSAWVGEHAWGCFACDFTEHLSTLARELGVAVPERGFSLEHYADRKAFPMPKLREWGLYTDEGKYGQPIVAIPYLNRDGSHFRTKYRHRTGTFWHNDGEGTQLYGLHLLDKHPDAPVILCEGESDCHAAWLVGILALGLPGAAQWRSEWAPLLAGRTVYVWEEPDAAGAGMVAKIAPDLPKARVLPADGVKDLADLYRQGAVGFKAAVRSRMAEAWPIGAAPPKVAFDAIVGHTLDRIRDAKLAPIDAVPTPLPSWSAACRGSGGGIGLARGWHLTIGGATGHGKSLVATNVIAAAIAAGERVATLSLEMSQEELATRLLAVVSGERVNSLEQGYSFDALAWKRASGLMAQLHEETGGLVFVNRGPVSKLDDVLAAIRYQVEVNGCRMVVTDYLQLVRSTGGRTRDERIEEVSHAIRELAMELGVVSVGLSQYNRSTSAQKDEAPSPQSLMGGSALENDSVQVLLLDHTQYTKYDSQADTVLILAKNRHGPTKEIPVRWDYSTLRLTERVPVGVLDDDALAEQRRRGPAPKRSQHAEFYATNGDQLEPAA